MSGPSQFTTETKETEGGVELTITREPNEDPDDTYWGAAKQIAKLTTEGPDFNSDVREILRKYCKLEADHWLFRMGQYCKMEFKYQDFGLDLGILPASEFDSRSEETFYGLANFIADLDAKDRSFRSKPEFILLIEPKIKKLHHHLKLVLGNFIKSTCWDKIDDFGKEVVQIKIETHEYYSKQPDDMQIYGRGRWLK